MDSKFNLLDHIIIMERKSKNKETGQWTTTKVQYLPVAWRLYWFRIDNPKGKIDSHALTLDLERGAAIFETYVEREDGGSARMHGSETAGDWKDYIEKAQTKSLGRALAAVGYGSQFTDDEFTEGERIVDSPVVVSGNGRKVVEADAAPAQPTVKNTLDNSPALPQQLSEIDRLVSALGKSPLVKPVTYKDANSLLTQLSREYNKAPSSKDTVAITRGELFERGEERRMWTRMAPSAFYAMASAITGRPQSKQDWTMTADEMAEMAKQIEAEKAAGTPGK